MTSDPNVVRAKEYRKIVADLAKQHESTVGVEIGVWKGGLSRELAEVPSFKHLILIDPWVVMPFYEKVGEEEIQMACEVVYRWAGAVHDPHISILRQTSMQAALSFRHSYFDFVHIDNGDHSYDSCYADIKLWWPKLVIGGILTGDNYEYKTVSKAVDQHVAEGYVPAMEILGRGRVWWCRKPK